MPLPIWMISARQVVKLKQKAPCLYENGNDKNRVQVVVEPVDDDKWKLFQQGKRRFPFPRI